MPLHTNFVCFGPTPQEQFSFILSIEMLASEISLPTPPNFQCPSIGKVQYMYGYFLGPQNSQTLSLPGSPNSSKMSHCENDRHHFKGIQEIEFVDLYHRSGVANGT